MPLIATRGAASAQGFGEFAQSAPATYIEDVFSTYLYTGTGSDQTLTTGVDLSTYGGMIWSKRRSAVENHFLQDTNRGLASRISSNTTGAAATTGAWPMNAISTTGMTVSGVNYAAGGETYVSWTFRKQAKFFDVVTYTGNGAGTQTINHSLGSTPGFIVVKRLNATSDWWVYHRSLSFGDSLRLNLTNAVAAVYEFGTVNSTSFQVVANALCASGGTYVAYIFAHNAGGFGLTGSGNVITCGSLTMDGSGNPASVTLGYEPQLVIAKRTDSTGAWYIEDNMRGMPVTGNGAQLYPNTSGAEATQNIAIPNATGFTWNIGIPSATYIYIAIRRGPMKTPTSGTSVFEPKTMSATQANLSITGVGFPPDLVINGVRSNANYGQQVTDRLRGVTKQVFTEYDSAENTTNGTAVVSLNMNGISLGADTAGTGWNAYSGYTSVKWMFGRAPNFFDEVCYTGTGSATTQTHNLGVAPELVIWKRRSSTSDWRVWQSSFSVNDGVYLNSTLAKDTDPNVQTAIPTATVLNLATGAYTNASGSTYVAYLFATCAGVSKVGSYTGTGALLTVNCGFAAGARFVLIKRTDSTGDWYTYDSARGISSSNDPYLLLNSAAAEVTGTNYVDTTSVGFQVTAAAPAGLNANGGTYIFLAIA